MSKITLEDSYINSEYEKMIAEWLLWAYLFRPWTEALAKASQEKQEAFNRSRP